MKEANEMVERVASSIVAAKSQGSNEYEWTFNIPEIREALESNLQPVSALKDLIVDKKIKTEDGVEHNFSLNRIPIGEVRKIFTRHAGTGWAVWFLDRKGKGFGSGATGMRVNNLNEAIRAIAGEIKAQWNKSKPAAVASKVGKYKRFTGKIDFKGTKGDVSGAYFELKGNGEIVWHNGLWHGGLPQSPLIKDERRH